MTKSKWVVKLFFSIVFIKLSVLQHCLSSTIPKIYTITISTSFNTFMCMTIWEDVSCFHKCVKSLRVKFNHSQLGVTIHCQNK